MIKGVILDLDGTVYMGEEEVPGASDFTAALREDSVRPLFVTNRSNRSPREVSAHLRRYGIACEDGDVLTSAQATAAHIAQGSVHYIGEDALGEALERAGIRITDRDPDYVVVSFDRGFTYDKMETAATLIHGGATYIATNPDGFLKTETGTRPGTGSIVAAVTTATGVDPIVIGKPERLIMDLALERLGLPAEEVIAVGDNVLTDIPAGSRAGMRTALLLTGITRRDEIASAAYQPTWVVDTYPGLLEIVRAENA